jgi:hypothetical protein
MRAVFDAQIKNNRNAADQLRMDKAEEFAMDIAHVYAGAGLSRSDARKMGGVVMEMLIAGKPLPPDINALPGTDNVVNFWNAIKPTWEKTLDILSKPHASELRTGRWYVKFTEPNGETGSASANNPLEKKALISFLQKRGDKIDLVEDRQDRPFNDFDLVSTRVAEGMLALEKVKYEAALANLDADSATRMRESYTIGQGVREELGKRKQFEAARKLRGGRELIDMYANQGAYAEVVSATLAKRSARREAAWLMDDESWSYDPALQADMKRFVNDILTTRNPSEAARNVMMATTAITMGANISGAAMDALQPLMIGAAYLAKSMGWKKAYQTIAKGYLDIDGKKDKEFNALLVRATNEKYFHNGLTFQESFHINDAAGFNVSQAGDRRNLIPLEDQITNHEFMAGKVMSMIKDFSGKAFDVGLTPTKLSNQLNSKIMLRAGMEEGKSLGYTGDALYNHAVYVMQTTNFQGGRAAHAAVKNRFGEANNWVQVATQLTNYPLSMISQMYGSYRDMLESSGLPADKRKRAREVFAGQLTMQFALAGSLGLGLGTLFKITEQIFGFSPEEEARKALAAVDSSGTLADVLMSGVANKVTGLDFASRFSLGGVMGLNDYTGFDAKGLFGPSATLWGGLAALPGDLSEGDLSGSVLIPSSIRKMTEAMTPGPFKDKAGQALIDPTTTERIAKFVGFNSDRVAEIRKQRNLYRFADESTQRENAKKLSDQSELLMNGDFDAVTTAIRLEVESKVPQWKAQGLKAGDIKKKVEQETRTQALKLVKSAVEKKYPTDPLANGDSASAPRRQAIAASFGRNLAPRKITPEQQKLAGQLLQGLGQATVRRSPRAVRITQLMQQLIEADPTLTEQDARFIAEQEVR